MSAPPGTFSIVACDATTGEIDLRRSVELDRALADQARSDPDFAPLASDAEFLSLVA